MFPAVSDSKLDSKFQEELTPEVLLIADKCVQLIQDTNTSQPDNPFDWFIKIWDLPLSIDNHTRILLFVSISVLSGI